MMYLSKSQPITVFIILSGITKGGLHFLTACPSTLLFVLHHSLFDITKQLRVQTFCSMLERLCKFFIVLMPSGLVSIQYIQQNSCKMARLPSITDVKTALS